MPESPSTFHKLLGGYDKFGYCHPDVLAEDLPALKEYHANLRLSIEGDLIAADTHLHDFDPGVIDGEDFSNAQMLAHSLKYIFERVIVLAEIGVSVSDKISKLEAKATGEAS